MRAEPRVKLITPHTAGQSLAWKSVCKQGAKRRAGREGEDAHRLTDVLTDRQTAPGVYRELRNE